MAIPSLIPIGAAADVLGLTSGSSADPNEGFLEKLQQLFASPTKKRAAEDATRSHETLAELDRLQQDISEFSQRLCDRLRAKGIDLTLPVELKSDGNGGVVVDDPHPQRAAIEQLFSDDALLTVSFQELAAACTRQELLRGPELCGWSEFRLKLDGRNGQVLFE